VDTQTVTIDKRFGSQYEGTYEFRMITQGEYEKILVSYMDAVGKVPKQDILKLNRECLWLSLVSQPEAKPLNRDLIVQGRLPYGFSLKLQQVYDKINGIDVEEERFLPQQLEKSAPTPSLPSS
jgi:hypothetical protein